MKLQKTKKRKLKLILGATVLIMLMSCGIYVQKKQQPIKESYNTFIEELHANKVKK